MDVKEKRLEDLISAINLSSMDCNATSGTADYSFDYNDTITLSSGSLSDSITLSDTITLSNTAAVTGAIGGSYTMPNITIANGGYATSAFGNVWGSNLAVGKSGQLDLTGENADIKINGKSLMHVIEALEQRLNLLTPNKELEAEWDELRELGKRYRALEKQCEEKAAMWKKLKSMPPPDIT